MQEVNIKLTIDQLNLLMSLVHAGIQWQQQTAGIALASVQSQANAQLNPVS